MKLKLFFILSSVFFSVQSFSGLLVDPYIGFGSSGVALEVDGAPAFGSDETENVTSFGSRLGYSFLLFSAGIDYEMAKVATENEATITNTSIFVGVDLPILLRAWAEYYVSSDFSASGSDLDFDFKDGYSIGIGFTGLPFVSINLEVQNVNYDFETSGAKGTLKTAGTLLSVSLPLDF